MLHKFIFIRQTFFIGMVMLIFIIVKMILRINLSFWEVTYFLTSPWLLHFSFTGNGYRDYKLLKLQLHVPAVSYRKPELNNDRHQANNNKY